MRKAASSACRAATSCSALARPSCSRLFSAPAASTVADSATRSAFIRCAISPTCPRAAAASLLLLPPTSCAVPMPPTLADDATSDATDDEVAPSDGGIGAGAGAGMVLASRPGDGGTAGTGRGVETGEGAADEDEAERGRGCNCGDGMAGMLRPGDGAEGLVATTEEGGGRARV